MDNPYYFSEKFCRTMAWIDMLLLANHSPGCFYKRGVKIEIGAGQLGWSIEALAKRWGWSRGKAERWLNELETSKQIVTQKTNITTLITILNYEYYQTGDKASGEADSKPNGHQTDTNKNNKEGKKGKEDVKPDKPADFIDKIIDEFVQAHGNYEVISKGKERAAASKLLSVYKKKFPAADSSETLESLRVYFDACVNIQDAWLRNNMSLSIIVSKFNEINNILKHGNKSRGTGATDAELAELFARKYGVTR